MYNLQDMFSYIKENKVRLEKEANEEGHQLAINLLYEFDNFVPEHMVYLQRAFSKYMAYNKPTTIPPLKYCETCNEIGDCGGTCDLCANCWEVQRRLETYLKHARGREFVEAKLNTAKKVGHD